MITVERKFVLIPDNAQQELINVTLKTCDEVYNCVLDVIKSRFLSTGKYVTRTEAGKLFSNVLLPTHISWKLADSRAIRDAATQCAVDFFKSKGEITPVAFNSYPRMYKTYAQNFSKEITDHIEIKLPKLGMVEVGNDDNISGYAGTIRIISERPNEYYALISDNMERVTLM